MLDPNASTARRVTISKILLLVVALAAASVAAQKPADILFLVSAAFSLAAAAFFPALVLRHLLEARQQVGRDARHDRRARASRSTTWRRRSPGCAACSA